ncbi:amidohydrolase family protein [Lignipirellula cremea]|uniref:Amidohydrolase n=1 Tax=Lignipirellula cremea TaxID=2528010 RepID=A0A518E341_9BACT|nr:amidohydrolase family protein [Lignipirellula cremea]QDU98504.1 Amidohydrolase [Lignipirellula cremea]
MPQPSPASSFSEFSRRGFHRLCLGGAVAAAAGSAALAVGPEVKQESTAPKVPPGKYIDSHVQLGQPWHERGSLTVEMLLRWMDAQEISQAWVMSLVSPESWFYPITPGWLLEQTKPFRDRLIPFCAIDPRTVDLGGYKGVLDLLKRYVDQGAKGFGEHKWGGPIDDPRSLEIFLACAELKLPVLLHLDAIRNIDKPGLPALEKVVREVPGCNFIVHGRGFWASISGTTTASDLGGLPQGAVTAGGALDRLLGKYPNLYADLSGDGAVNALRRDMKFAREFLVRRADRVLFGTEYHADKQAAPQFALLTELQLPPDVQARIFRTNAQRLVVAR